MRVVSWNVRSLRDDEGGVVELVRALAPDIVVLQEAPRLWRWRTSRRRLARRCGLRLVTRQRAAGNCVLAAPTVEVLTSYAVAFPKRAGLHRRATAGVLVRLEGRRACVAGTHLDLDAGARLDSAARVRAAVPSGVPLVLCADVNDTPGSAAWAVLADGLVDKGEALTFPATGPERRLDALLVHPALLVRSHVVVESHASDHRPIAADIGWR